MSEERDPHLHPGAKLSDTPCPRCGCYITRLFECHCGEVHSDYCDNCGRFTSIAPTESVRLSDFDDTCTHGHAAHVHSPEERQARIARGHARGREYVELFQWRAKHLGANESLFAILVKLGDPLGADALLPELPRELENVWSRFGHLDQDERTAYVRAWLWTRETESHRTE
jgi:hypothetical protein